MEEKEEVRSFSEFLSLARAIRSSQTSFVRSLVYRAHQTEPENRNASKDLVSVAQLVSAAFIHLEGYRFEDLQLQTTGQGVIESLRESVDILGEIGRDAATRIGLSVVSSEAPVASKEMVLAQAKRNFGL